MPQENTHSDIWIAGAFAAFTVDLLIYPLDTLKTRIQSPEYRRLFVHETTGLVNRPALFRGLYQGVGTVILVTLPSSGAFFSTYEGTKSFLHCHNPVISGLSPGVTNHALVPTPLIHASASAFAELVSCAILTPAEVLKQNAQMVQRQSSTMASSALAETLGRFRSNPLALWRGYGALASRNLPFTAIQFPLYEHLRASLTSWRRGGREADITLGEKAVITAVSGGAAGSLASLVTTPVDVVKTRIMLSASHSSEAVASAKAVEAIKDGKVLDAVGAIRGGTSSQKTGMEIVREIVREHGWKGLFRGGALRCGGTMLSSALYLGVYESGRQYLSGRRHRSED